MRMRKAVLPALGALALALLVGYGLRVLADGAPTTQPTFYAGTLEADGELIAGVYTITLRFVDAEVGGTELCASETPGASVDNGRFRVAVSDACVKEMRETPDIWVGVEFTDASTGSTRKLPRAKIGAVPYALEAQHAVNASNAGTASAAAGALATQVVPAGAVMAFNLNTCPAGWTELVSARGRTIVGANPTAGGGLSARSRGAAFGAETVVLAAANLPPHAHAGTTGSGNPMYYRVVHDWNVTVRDHQVALRSPIG